MLEPTSPLHVDHPRSFASYRYVYPVLSRRSGGLSIGVNLNLNQYCNFRCVYCQVQREKRPPQEEVDLKLLAEELDAIVRYASSEAIFNSPPFDRTPDCLRRLNDIAFSGDGEPTASPFFAEATTICAQTRLRYGLNDLKLVLITNATLLDRPKVRDGLAVLDQNNGEIWAKLDAGTEAYYEQVSRSAVPFAKILENLRETAKVRPIVIQTLFMRTHDQTPKAEEIAAYCERLREILAAGGKIKLVQIHTIARITAEPWATPLKNREVDAIVAQVEQETGLPVQAYYGYAAE